MHVGLPAELGPPSPALASTPDHAGRATHSLIHSPPHLLAHVAGDQYLVFAGKRPKRLKSQLFPT